jgi:hypothetical protein
MLLPDRDPLMARPLADLHAIARELGIARFRLLRKVELADAIAGRLAIQESGEVTRALRARGQRSRRRRGFGLPRA